MNSIAQPEARAYVGVYEKAGISGGHKFNKVRFETNYAFRRDKVPVYEYYYTAFWQPASFDDMQRAYQLYGDNQWKRKVSILTFRALWSERTSRELVQFYGGPFMRWQFESAHDNSELWNASEISFAESHRLPEKAKSVVFNLGLVFGARGRVEGNVFWDINIGGRVFVRREREKLTFNDGSVEENKISYSYRDGGDFILQAGFGYWFGRAETPTK